MTENISVVIVGKDRTMMTIECIKNVIHYLRGCNYNMIIGSDRSSDGHIQAIDFYLKSLNINYKILNCVSLGGMLNLCLNEAFLFSDYALCIENDMILHKELSLSEYIDVLKNTNAGNLQFRYFSPDTHKCNCGIMQYKNKNYVYTFPCHDIADGNPVSFGQNLISKKFYNKIGHFLDNEFQTDKVERDFVNKYSKQFISNDFPLLNILDCETLHRNMNDSRGYFYHIGIQSQHANVKWNTSIIPNYYHYLSDDSLDKKFREIFVQ